MLIKSKEIDFYLVENNEELCKLLALLRKQTRIAVDTESYPDYDYKEVASALDPHTSKLRLIQFNWKGNKTPFILDMHRFDLSEAALESMKDLLMSDVEKIAHNAVFEINMFRKAFGYRSKNFKCTMVSMQLIGGATGSKSAKMRGYGYAALCRDFMDVRVDKTEQTSDWGREVLSDEQLIYAALDVGAPKDSGYSSLLVEAYELLLGAIEDPQIYNMTYIHEVDQKAMGVIASMQYVGSPVNVHIFDALYKKLIIEVEELKLELCKEMGFAVNPRVSVRAGIPSVIYEVSDATSKLLNNPTGLVAHLRRILKSTGEDLTDLRAETLQNLLYELQTDGDDEEDEDEVTNQDEERLRDIAVINTLLDYKKVVKMLGTDYRKMVNPVTGCIHSQFKTIGCATGRMSSGGKIKTEDGEVNYNCQQIGNKTFPVLIDKDKLFCSSSIMV